MRSHKKEDASLQTISRGKDATEEKRVRVIKAAGPVFLKYGYGRVTMHDLADAAGMSRPALYLVFSKKEDIFRGVMLKMMHEIAAEAGRGVADIQSPLDRLKFIFEVWIIRPFEWGIQSSEAREVFESTHQFAQDVVAEGMAQMESDLAQALDDFPKSALSRNVSSKQAAHLLASATGGFKKVCKTSNELREMIHSMIALTVRA